MDLLSRPEHTASWHPGPLPAVFAAAELAEHVRRVREPAHVVMAPGCGRGLALGGTVRHGGGGYPVLGILPPLYPEWLGDRAFCEAHRVRFPYVAGEMANGIAGVRMVVAMAEAEMLGFLGAAGLGLDELEGAIGQLRTALPHRSNWGVNLIHHDDPEAEQQVADLLLRQGVPRISLSALTDLTPAAVCCAATGLRRDARGRVVRATRVFAKVSRPEVAAKFMSPPPADLLRALVEQRRITQDEARSAASVPVADDVTVEADSGGHTDNRPLTAVLPVILGLRDDLVRRFGYRDPIRVGAAGGLGTPSAVASAFALGAAYVLTGSVNQTAVEAALSAEAKQLLARAGVSDVTMAPSADMFEQGARVQVLRRGTMFAARAGRLHQIYQAHSSLEDIPAQVRAKLETDVLRVSFDEAWAETRQFWQHRSPGEVTRAERDPKHRMALVFRWYLGKSSRWAVDGDRSRTADYQLWCGPAMGAFNNWAEGSFLAEPGNRTVVQIARNLLEGAAVVTRAQQLRSYGLPLPADAFSFRPRPLNQAPGGSGS